jgi:cytochrome c
MVTPKLDYGKLRFFENCLIVVQSEQKNNPMRTLFSLILALTAASAYSEEAEQIAKRYSCMGCHSVDKHSMVVPSLQKIAEKYKDDPNAVSYLEDKIASGSKGVWSTSAKSMPAYPMLKRDELKILAEWIAGIK